MTILRKSVVMTETFKYSHKIKIKKPPSSVIDFVMQIF